MNPLPNGERSPDWQTPVLALPPLRIFLSHQREFPVNIAIFHPCIKTIVGKA